mgnify:CR=1 FL=1
MVADAGEPIWLRDVELIGTRSQCRYAQARSFIRQSLLPDKLRAELAEDRLGIGGVIRELGMETYRKIVAVGQSPVSPNSPDRVWRSYCLYYKAHVLVHITETFELKHF